MAERKRSATGLVDLSRMLVRDYCHGRCDGTSFAVLESWWSEFESLPIYRHFPKKAGEKRPNNGVRFSAVGHLQGPNVFTQRWITSSLWYKHYATAMGIVSRLFFKARDRVGRTPIAISQYPDTIPLL